MFITRKHLPRRTFLQAAGAAIGLPFLDAMVPALTAQTKPAPRLSFVYLPHGAIMDQWTPKKEGSGFELSPILQPLKAFRDQMNIISGLGHAAADTSAVHSLSPTTWLPFRRRLAKPAASIRAARSPSAWTPLRGRNGSPADHATNRTALETICSQPLP